MKVVDQALKVLLGLVGLLFVLPLIYGLIKALLPVLGGLIGLLLAIKIASRYSKW